MSPDLIIWEFLTINHLVHFQENILLDNHREKMLQSFISDKRGIMSYYNNENNAARVKLCHPEVCNDEMDVRILRARSRKSFP